MKTLYPNALQLVVTRQWFRMIMSGKKPEEYRDITPYWNKRIENAILRGGKHIVFREGYKRNAATMAVEWNNKTIGMGRKEWGASGTEQHILKLGKIVQIMY